MGTLGSTLVVLFWGAVKVGADFALSAWLLSGPIIAQTTQATTQSTTGVGTRDNQVIIGVIGAIVLALQIINTIVNNLSKRQDRLTAAQRHQYDAEDREHKARELEKVTLMAAEELRKASKIRNDRVERKLDKQSDMIAIPLLADGAPEHIKQQIRKEVAAYDSLKRTPEEEHAEEPIPSKVLQRDHRDGESPHGGVLRSEPPPA